MKRKVYINPLTENVILSGGVIMKTLGDASTPTGMAPSVRPAANSNAPVTF